jgi:ATP-dependent protease ClpP protease subunit
MEIYLYGGIGDYSAPEIIESINNAGGEDITMRINSYGGNVFAGYGIIAKMQETESNVKIKVDGWAASMAAFMTLFADDVECLDVSEFLFHRADMYSPTDEEKRFVQGVNAKMRKKMEQKIAPELWQQVTGKTFDEMFNPDQRNDIRIDAKQAKKLGIVKKIIPLTAGDAKKVSAMYDKCFSETERERFPIRAEIRAAAQTEPVQETDPAQTQKIENKPINKPKMTIETLKAEHPDVYAAAVNSGVEQERDRIGAFLVYADVDMKAVKAGIESGKQITQTQIAELSRKSLQVAALGTAATETDKTVTTDAPKSAEEIADAEVKAAQDRILARTRERLNINAK